MSQLAESNTDTVGAANPVLRLHHHAYRARDMEATRHFYEDILGMPLVGAFVETWDDVNKTETNYVHAYFELGDGSCLAFFSFADGYYHPSKIGNGGLQPTDPFDHHIACEVDGIETIRAVQKRAEDAGIAHFVVDHGYCYSIYLVDPNNMHFELTTKVPATEAIMSEQRVTARATLNSWLAGKQIGNNTWRGTTSGADHH